MAEIVVPTEGRPNDTVNSADLLGCDGNAFGVMGQTQRLLRQAGASKEFVTAYMNEAMSGSYEHLLAASMAFLDSGGN